MFLFKKSPSHIYQETDIAGLIESLHEPDKKSVERAFKYVLSNCHADNAPYVAVIVQLIRPADEDVDAYIMKFKDVISKYATINVVRLACIVYYYYRLRMVDPDQRKQLENAIYFKSIKLDATLKLPELHARWDELYDKDRNISVDGLYSSARQWYLEASINQSNFAARVQLFGIPITRKSLDGNNIIGQGGFARAYVEKEPDNAPPKAVIKVMHKSGMLSRRHVVQEKMNMLMIEISILSELSHSNIIEFRGAYASQYGSKYGLKLEYMPIVLSDLIDEQITGFGGPYYKDLRDLSYPFKRKIMCDILSGLHYLHENKITHCDIKSPNILLSVQEGDMSAAACPTDHVVAKIADFGLAERSENRKNSLRGSIEYHAPEILRQCAYSGASDMFAFGIVAWELCTLQVPYVDKLEKEIFIYVLMQHGRPIIPGDIREDDKQVIKNTWKEKPEERWTAHQALSFFSSPQHSDIMRCQDAENTKAPSG
jgi:hypothetical protein